jgi:hypothetical protein
VIKTLFLIRQVNSSNYNLPWNLGTVLAVRTLEEMYEYAPQVLVAWIPGDHARFPEWTAVESLLPVLVIPLEVGSTITSITFHPVHSFLVKGSEVQILSG